MNSARRSHCAASIHVKTNTKTLRIIISTPVTAFLRANAYIVRSTRSWNFLYTCLPIRRSCTDIWHYNNDDDYNIINTNLSSSGYLQVSTRECPFLHHHRTNTLDGPRYLMINNAVIAQVKGTHVTQNGRSPYICKNNLKTFFSITTFPILYAGAHGFSKNLGATSKF